MMLSAIDSRARSQVMLSLFQFTINLPQIIERAVRAHSRRGGRAIEHARDIVVLEIVITGEHEHRALLRIEPRHRLLEQGVTLAHRFRMELQLWLVARVVHGFVSSILSPVLVADVVRHAIQPRREGGIAAEAVAVSQHAQKRLLREIVGCVGMARQPIAERVHPRVMPLEEHAELLDVPFAHGAHHRFVGCVVHARKPRVSVSFLRMTEGGGRFVTAKMGSDPNSVKWGQTPIRSELDVPARPGPLRAGIVGAIVATARLLPQQRRFDDEVRRLEHVELLRGTGGKSRPDLRETL